MRLHVRGRGLPDEQHVDWWIVDGVLSAEPVADALVGNSRQAHVEPGVYVHFDRINSIRVGAVHVFFERPTKEEAEPEDEPKAKRRTFDYVADADLKAPLGTSIRDLERLGSRVRS